MKRYIDEFIKQYKSAADMIALGLFPNGKEITESMAIYRAVREHLDLLKFNDPTVAFVSVGDGCVPRTAALFAFKTAWTCYAIDPNLKGNWDPIKRLTVISKKIEEIGLNLSEHTDVVIALVHSHASVKASLASICGRRRHVIAMPCCVQLELPGVPYLGYQDTNIWSPKNTIKIWKDLSTCAGS